MHKPQTDAYSWWWASHIRTKQSKWLDGNLREMEETVQKMIMLVEPNADSFAKRAELYFKRRPELLGQIEDAYRAYRGLAEKYDRVSTELQRANRTIATACPEQVQYSMLEEEEDENCQKAFTPLDPSRINKQTVESLIKRRRTGSEFSLKKSPDRRSMPEVDAATAQEEITKLEKTMLVLQSEKQFIRSSYETGIVKYWEVEKQIMEMQDDISSWQDGFRPTTEEEARMIMADTALQSCEDSLARVQEQRKDSRRQAEVELEKFKIIKEKLNALKIEFGQAQLENEAKGNETVERSFFNSEIIEKETDSLDKAKLQLHSVREKINEYFSTNPESSVVEVVNKINELVNIIVTLEIAVSSQTAHINRLTSKSDGLEKNLQSMEEERMTVIEDSSLLSERMKEAEEELGDMLAIEKFLHDEEKSFYENLMAVCQGLTGISEKLLPPQPEEEACAAEHESAVEDVGFLECAQILTEEASVSVTEPTIDSNDEAVAEIRDIKGDLVEEIHVTQPLVVFLENFLQKEAASALKNDSEKPHETPKRSEDYIKEMMALIGELVNIIAIRDEEIRLLKEQLASLKLKLRISSDFETPRDSNTESRISGESVDEQKIDIENLLGKNLDFWLRFSTTYNYIQQLKSKYAELQADINKLSDVNPEEGEETAEPIAKRLNTLKAELQVWSEQSAVLGEELQRRFQTLNHMQEEITSVADTTTSTSKFTPDEAERLRSEVMIMKQESSKTSTRLQAELDQVKGASGGIEKQLSRLYESFHLLMAGSGGNPIKEGVPLSIFLYGTKSPPAAKKPSLFAKIRPLFRKHKRHAASG